MNDQDKEMWCDLILTVFGYFDIDDLVEKYSELLEQNLTE